VKHRLVTFIVTVTATPVAAVTLTARTATGRGRHRHSPAQTPGGNPGHELQKVCPTLPYWQSVKTLAFKMGISSAKYSRMNIDCQPLRCIHLWRPSCIRKKSGGRRLPPGWQRRPKWFPDSPKSNSSLIFPRGSRAAAHEQCGSISSRFEVLNLICCRQVGATNLITFNSYT
jgi:hypothetical protein